MAYAALISLKQTLHRLLHSSQPPFNASSTRQILESAHNHSTSLQLILSSGDLLDLDEQIRDAANNLEDLLELHELDHSLTQGFVKVKQGLKSFCETAEKIEIDHPSPHEEEEEEEINDDEAVQPDEILVADPFDHTEMKYRLTERMRPNDFGVFQITGLPGCGATVAAITVFEDLKNCFDCRARVRVGPRYERKGILLAILAQINEPDENDLDSKAAEEIGKFLYASLMDRRYMIVLDDVRDVEAWDFLESFFPVQDNGSAVLFTTRQRLVQIRNSFMVYDMATRSQDVRWYLFQAGVFGEDPCPPELEEAGKKIVQNCRSLGVQVLKVVL